MIRRQLVARGIRCQRVLEAIRRVPRDEFIQAEYRGLAFADQALPIPCGQTISQPYMVALMTELLELRGEEHVLEIGTGSGYQTAVLCELAHHVTTVERHEQLSVLAQERLLRAGYENVTFIVGDGTTGCEKYSPYDRVLLTAAATRCPACLLEQLSQQGVFVGPIGGPDQQTLVRLSKHGGDVKRESFVTCRFVPLIGRYSVDP